MNSQVAKKSNSASALGQLQAVYSLRGKNSSMNLQFAEKFNRVVRWEQL